jgi:hypothetical protein
MVAALAAAAIPHAAGHNKSRRYRSAKIAVAQTAAFSALSSNAPVATVPDAVTQMAATVGRDYGVDVAQTRAVTGPDGATWYLLPGTGGLCFYVSHLGGCGSWDNAVNGRLFIAALPNPASSAVAATAPPGASEVIGVAPNAISDVAANGDDTPVSSNVYRLKTTNATSSRWAAGSSWRPAHGPPASMRRPAYLAGRLRPLGSAQRTQRERGAGAGPRSWPLGSLPPDASASPNCRQRLRGPEASRGEA